MVAAMLTLPGCSSAPKADWEGRVGTFTFDQAVLELGPPDRETRLENGTRVGEWLVRRNPTVSFGVGTGFSGGATSVGVGQSVSSAPSGRYLRLQFDGEGTLEEWGTVKR